MAERDQLAARHLPESVILIQLGWAVTSGGSNGPSMDLGWYPRFWNCYDDRLPYVGSEEEVGLTKSGSLQRLRWKDMRSGIDANVNGKPCGGPAEVSRRSATETFQLIRPPAANIAETGAWRFARSFFHP